MDSNVTHLREYWLAHATKFLLDHMAKHGLPPVRVRVSCGWPSSGGMGHHKRVIGQCFPPTMCRDGVSQIFVSPVLADGVDVLGTLLHELVHASIGCQHGHRAPFSQAARKVGLEGPPTTTIVSKDLRPLLESYIQQAGTYPHAAIVPRTKEKKGSRLRLYECCCTPPVKVRVASDDYQARCLRCKQCFRLVDGEE